ncbi:hypothetical protein Mal15_28290 [Stieleria maiorica]|uniref:Uncharacterized protein n=1 Tax=Stieleria maiorica TaxID=2795974 RepID=A0A5B9MDC2_9BACT|nr:hypothetical protein [Stieleria maiorica]QEF98773.1 hypothetical protein Mal15_28290 [Stieleria maiorica]
MWQRDLNQSYADLITAGCDSRLVPGSDGLNRYGCSVSPRRQFALGSCSCSSPSPRGVAAAEQLLAQLQSSNARSSMVDQTLGEVRSCLRTHLQLPDDADIALTPSGTDAELLAVTLADRDPSRSIVNIVVGPGEVGSGTLRAASGQHYDDRVPHGDRVVPGSPVDAGLSRRIRPETVQIRHSDGKIRTATEIDAEIHQRVTAAVADGHQVLLHAVAHSKTGVFAPRLRVLDLIRSHLHRDVVVLIDAAQARLGRGFATVGYRALLERGFMINVTGSKFFGGPPFSAALLVPKSMQIERRSRGIPSALGSYFSRAEMPASWTAIRNSLDPWINLPALLRWKAAAAEITSFASIGTRPLNEIVARFADSTVRHHSSRPEIELCDPFDHRDSDWADGDSEPYPTVFSFFVNDGTNRLDKQALSRLHRSVNDAQNSMPIHLGQPVTLAPGHHVLRIALGAPLVTQIAHDSQWGNDLEARLDRLDDRISRVADCLATESRKLHPTQDQVRG